MLLENQSIIIESPDYQHHAQIYTNFRLELRPPLAGKHAAVFFYGFYALLVAILGNIKMFPAVQSLDITSV